MEITSYPNFIPMTIASNYYEMWSSDLITKNQINTYYKCLEGECEIELKNNCHYKGQIKDGLYQGKGIFTWGNGMIYEGDFKCSQITGVGKLTWPNGSYYEGQVLNGQRNGLGTFYSSKECYKYIGEWKNGKKQGKGKIQYKDQSNYEGNFKKDKKNGFGKMIYASKNQYQGEWIQDKKQGKGTMNWYSAHEKYTGQWKNDLQDGYGQYYWLQNKTQYKIFKNVYKGYWRRGKRHGFGVFFYSNGCKYEGYFFNNLKEGIGISIDEQGIAKLQTYKNNRLMQIKQKNLSSNKQQAKKKQGQQQNKLPTLQKKGSKNQIQSNLGPDQVISKQIHSNPGQKSLQNEYKRYLDFNYEEINQNFYNMLLRFNSRLRNLYKMIGTSNMSVKDYYSGMILQNYWKSLRQCKLLNQNLSLVAVDREFHRGTRAYFYLNLSQQKILQILNEEKYSLQKVSYQNVLWHDYFLKVNEQFSLNWQQFSLSNKSKLRLNQRRSSTIVDIHHSSNIILFRHFVCLIIHTAILYDQSAQKPLKQKVQNLINILQHSNDTNIKIQRTQVQDSTTQITRSIMVPDWVKSIHQELVYELQRPKHNFMKKLDVSVSVRRMYSVLQSCCIFKDINQKILYLERIERYLNIKNSPLKKQFRNYVLEIDRNLKSNPAFGYLMNYQMNLKQINQFLFLCISRKILAASQEQFQNKYKQIVKNMLMFIQTQKQRVSSSAFYFKKTTDLRQKKVTSWKDKKKEEMIIEAQKQKQKKIQQQKQKKQLQRQKIQRQAMAKQDIDVEDIVTESEDSEEYYG